MSYAPRIRPQWHVQFQAGTRQHHFSNEILGALRDLPGLAGLEPCHPRIIEQLAMEAMAHLYHLWMIYIDLQYRTGSPMEQGLLFGRFCQD